MHFLLLVFLFVVAVEDAPLLPPGDSVSTIVSNLNTLLNIESTIQSIYSAAIYPIISQWIDSLNGEEQLRILEVGAGTVDLFAAALFCPSLYCHLSTPLYCPLFVRLSTRVCCCLF